MFSPETVHPPTRITDLLNPVGGPEAAPRLPPVRGQSNGLPSFSTIERAATGPRPPDYSLPPISQTSATRSTAEEVPPVPQGYDRSTPRHSYDGQQQHAQFSLRAASWDSSKSASTSVHDQYRNGQQTVPSSQGRQGVDAFHPANGSHAMHPYAGSVYETRQAAPTTLPSMNWTAASAPSAMHAQYGRGQSAGLGPAAHPHEPSLQSMRQQTSLPPAPVVFGPHFHHPQAPTRGHLPPYSPGAMGGAPPTATSGDGSETDAMGRVVEHSPYQLSERVSVRLAAKGTVARGQMPAPAPVGPYMQTPYFLPIVVSIPSPATTQAHSSHPQPYLHFRSSPQAPQDQLERKRSHNTLSAGDSGTTGSPRPASLTSAANSRSSADDQPKPKKARIRSKATSGSAGASEKTNVKRNPSKKRNEEGADLNANDITSASTSQASAASKGRDKADGPAFGHMQTMDAHAGLPFGYVGYGVGIMPVGPHATGTMGLQSYQLPMILQMVPGMRSKPTPELQYARCMSNRYKTDAFPRCVSCTRRWAGDTCRFQGIRILLRDENKNLVAVSFMESTKPDAAKMNLPDKWNVKLEERHVRRTMATVAKALLPHLKKEQNHIKQQNVVRRPRETDVRATCDTCMTSLFSSSWMCRQCGREACEQCYKTVCELTADPHRRESIARRERHAQANPFFLSCTRRTEHTVITFNPVSRFMQAELDDSVKEMEQLVEKAADLLPEKVKVDRKNDSKVGTIVGSDEIAGVPLMGNERAGRENSGANQEQNQAAGGAETRADNRRHTSTEGASNAATVDPVTNPSTNGTETVAERSSMPSSLILQEGLPQSPPSLSANPAHATNGSIFEGYDYDDGVCTLVSNPTPPSSSSASLSSSSLPPTSPTPLPIPTWPVPYYTVDRLTEMGFATLWAKGVPLVVTDLLKRFQIQWTPEYFKATYGTQGCIIVECQLDTNKRITVGEFFNSFGKYDGRTECWKLKDWPPSTDFKTAFPELYEDFSRAVPVPSYTRRDGAMNIASHFPSNTIAPDLGPKMYNAFASKDEPGSKGSTRLHMDMADAVNIMQHAEQTPDGAPGSAVWDIYRSEDSARLRQFLKKHFKGKFQNDPIHAQLFYLDVGLRRQLYDEYGVKGFRIYQRPGEAVFIPAGCAHQVLNLADCVKVACDFVSPENIERCERLTEEFRDQNQSMVWKEDVLQLRTMMWYAWLSCRKQLQQNQEKWGTVASSVPNGKANTTVNGGPDGKEKESADSKMDVDAANELRLGMEETLSSLSEQSAIDGRRSTGARPIRDQKRAKDEEGKPPDIRQQVVEDSKVNRANASEGYKKNTVNP